MENLIPLYRSIEKVFTYSYKIPVYQRPYSWEEENIDCLFDDMWKSYIEYKDLNNDEQKNHDLYIGNIIIQKKGVDTYEIIDGQQRLTTIAIILLCLYCRCRELQCNKEHGILRMISGILWKQDKNNDPVMNQRVIELGNLDKDIFQRLFDSAFSNPNGFKKDLDTIIANNLFENNFKKIVLRIYDNIINKIGTSNDALEDCLQFSKFILQHVCVVSISSEKEGFEAFTVFESINSKGKQLEDIDLIKTAIFSTLKEEDYIIYSNKWGQLITLTEDKLHEYLIIFIKSYIKFYEGDIHYNNFKKLKNELANYYDVDNLDEAYKKLVDDMIAKINSFNALRKKELAFNASNDTEFRFYYLLYLKKVYRHPNPVFF